MNVLQVTPSSVYPPDRGGEHRSHGLVSQFPNHGHTVIRIAAPSSFTSQENIQIDDGYYEIREQSLIRLLSKFPIRFNLPNIFSDVSLNIVGSKVMSQMTEWPDIVLVEGPWQFPAIEKLYSETPIVFSSHNVEIERYKSNSIISDCFVRGLKNLESYALREAELTICTSERDKENFLNEYNVNSDLIVIPNGIYKDQILDGNSARSVELCNKCVNEDAVIGVFVGSSQAPNIEAVQFLLDIFDDFNSNFELFIIGEVCGEFSSVPERVHLEGYVDDLSYYYLGSDIALNPMLSGSGTNIKMLEYMAYKLPVVTTNFGSRGFNLESGNHAIVTDIDDFYEGVNELIRDKSLREDLRFQSTSFVKDTYTWESLSETLSQELTRKFI